MCRIIMVLRSVRWQMYNRKFSLHYHAESILEPPPHYQRSAHRGQPIELVACHLQGLVT